MGACHRDRARAVISFSRVSDLSRTFLADLLRPSLLSRASAKSRPKRRVFPLGEQEEAGIGPGLNVLGMRELESA
jgi:hypothetical protein